MKLSNPIILLVVPLVILFGYLVFNKNEILFNINYRALEKHRSQSHVQFSSKTSDYNDCDAFRKIVKGGEKNIPFIMEKIVEGDFFLNQAMHEITGVDIINLYVISQIDIAFLTKLKRSNF